MHQVKCVVWDLDDTIWDGTLLETTDVQLRCGVRDCLELLDARGILHSIASRTDYTQALAKLRSFGLAEYFLCPQIGFSSKVDSIRMIAGKLNLSTDSFAFVDDQPIERDEVKHFMPEVLCIDSSDLTKITDAPEFVPHFVTQDGKQRRQMYREDFQRQAAEVDFHGCKEEFLRTLNLVLTVEPTQEGQLTRAHELTQRTHQLSSTGVTYSFEELERFRTGHNCALLSVHLADRYGSYGQVGLALVELGSASWTIKLLLVSCRVISRGVGSVLLLYLLHSARAAGVTLRCEFMHTDRNRIAYTTLKLAGFREIDQSDAVSILAHDGANVPPLPEYLRIVAPDGIVRY